MGILEFFFQCIYSVTLFGALTVLLLKYFISSIFSAQKHRKEPPGPTPLSLIGNLLQLGLKRTAATLLELSKEYGSVFTVYLGPKKVVVLVGYKTVKEALVNNAEVFGDRDPVRIMDELIQGHGIIWANDESWKEIRRFTMMKLKEFGMGKKESEDKIMEESRYLIEIFKEFKGEAVDVTPSLNKATANIICSMIYGSRFDYNDTVFTSLIERACRNNSLLWSPPVQIYNLFPWIGRWFSSPKKFKKSFVSSRKVQLKLLSHLKETLNPTMCRGFVDAFMVHQENLEKSGITTSHFTDENLLVTVINLFFAGTESTSRTLKWGLHLMAKHPQIQDQVRAELSRVIGGRRVQIKDRTDLPLTNAVIHETQRLVAIAPQGIPHRTSQDITFRGHFIKKGTTVFPHMLSVLSDESEWEKPFTFHPAHFLDKDGKFVKRNAFMPFSAGRRICPGEILAKIELFIFFTTLLQHFRFTLPPGVSEDQLGLSQCDCFVLNPSQVKLCAVPLI